MSPQASGYSWDCQMNGRNWTTQKLLWTRDLRWPARLARQENPPAGYSKSSSSKAAADESTGGVAPSHPPTPSCQDSLFSEWATLRMLSRGERCMGKGASRRARVWRVRKAAFSAACQTKGGSGAYTTGCPITRSNQGAIRSSFRGARFRRASMWNPLSLPTIPIMAEASSPSGSSSCV